MGHDVISAHGDIITRPSEGKRPSEQSPRWACRRHRAKRAGGGGERAGGVLSLPAPVAQGEAVTARGDGCGGAGGTPGGVNTRTGRTGNTCKAVSMPPTHTATNCTHSLQLFSGFFLLFFSPPHASQCISGRQSLSALPTQHRGTGSAPPFPGGGERHLPAARRGPGGAAAHRPDQPAWAGGGEKRTGRGEKIIAYLMRCSAKGGFSRDGTGGGAAVMPHTHPRPPAHTQKPPCAGVVIIFVNFLSTVC